MKYAQVKEICAPSQQPLAMCPINNFVRCTAQNCPLTNMEEKNLEKTRQIKKEVKSMQRQIDKLYTKVIEIDDSSVENLIANLQDNIDNINELIQ